MAWKKKVNMWAFSILKYDGIRASKTEWVGEWVLLQILNIIDSSMWLMEVILNRLKDDLRDISYL